MISLAVKNLSKRYGSNRVLHKIRLNHTTGVLGISGSNGSGKSTLIKCLSGLLRPTSGSIVWRNKAQEIPRQSLKQYMGFIAPYISLYGQLTVTENLNFLKKLRGSKDIINVRDTLEKVGLKELDNRLYGTLSTGQQQRVKLAAAIFHRPKVLMMDEPGANLDEAGRQLISDLIQEMKVKNSMVIIASNQPAELSLCDTIYSVE